MNQAKKLSSSINIRDKSKQPDSTFIKIEVGKSFQTPKWNIDEDFLKFYYQLPIEINFLDEASEDDPYSQNWNFRDMSKHKQPQEHENVYKFLLE